MGGLPREIRVLHVEDDQNFADLTKTYLEREDEGFTVETATSASDGLDRIEDGDVDCIVSDYDMPGQDGIEFLEDVRAERPDLPFILFTGKGSEEVASEALTKGATDYLQKESGSDQYTLLANRVRNAVEQYRAKQRAAELDRIRAIVEDSNQTLVRADDRDEIEREICETLSDADPYRFAWIAGIDEAADRLEPRAWAGVEEGYLDEITVATDEEPRGLGPGGTAYRERRVAVSQNVQEDPEFEPWREAALERGFQAVAAVPLEHVGELYGILGVYADRPYAFDEDERELLQELGDDVAHALHSCEVERELRRERDKFRHLVDSVEQYAISLLDTGGCVSTWNTGAERIYGYEEAEIRGDHYRRFFPEDEIEDGRPERLLTRAENEGTAEAEGWRVAKDGSRFWASVSITPLYDESGDLRGYAKVTRDLSDRRERERKIEQAATVFRNVRDAVFLVDVTDDGEFRIQQVNPAYEEQTGLSADAVHGKTPREVFGEESGADIEARYRECVERNEPVEYEEELSIEGETSYWHTRIAPVAEDGTVVQLVGVSRNVTDRRRRERKLQRQNEKIAALHEVATDIDACESPDTVYELIVDAAESVLDFDIAIADAAEGDVLIPQAVSSNLSADQYYEETPVDADDNLAALAYRTGESSVVDDLEDSDVAPADPEFRSVLTVPIGDHGVFQAVAKEPDVFDETDRELTELLAAHGRAQLTQLDRERALRERTEELRRQNERLDQFASVVSHDLRNPINVAAASVAQAEEECETEQLEDAAYALDRMESLIDDLLALAREGDEIGETEAIDVATLVERCWRTVATEDAALRTEIDRRVRADPDRLQQLFENLLQNSVEHGDDDVSITIGELSDGDGFYVADDGPGIPPDERDRLFEFGVSTDDGGTGFGLAIVRDVAEAHDWSIAVTDSEDGGARFEITGVEFVDE